MISAGLTFSFFGTEYRILPADAQAVMKGQSLRVELRLNGMLHARYQGQYVCVAVCQEISESATEQKAKAARKPTRKDHNAGGKSHWMQGFWDSPAPPMRKLKPPLQIHKERRAKTARRSLALN